MPKNKTEQKNTTLKPHQIRALTKLQKSNEGIIAYHGLGSGKTLTGLAAARLNNGASVIGPASLKDNFKDENKKHKVKANIDYSTYSKPTPKSKDLVIYDEGHRMGRMGSQRSQYPDKFEAKRNLILTGTPIRNEPSELIPLFRAVGVDMPRDKKKFYDKYIRTEDVDPGFVARLKGVKPGVTHSGKNLDELKRKLKGRVDYHPSGKEGYPSVNSEDISVEMSENQVKAYRMALKGKPSLSYKVRYGIPPNKSEAGAMNAFLNATRQISNTSTGYNLKAEGDVSPKVERIAKDIGESFKKDPNYKGVTYSNYLGSGINRVESRLKEMKIPYGKFTGKVDDKTRDKLIKDYNSGKIKQLLISGAGSEGLDLKGTKMVQIMEPHWNDTRLEQVKGRAIRFKSHDLLPEGERNVKVKNYMSILPKGDKYKEMLFGREKSTDEYLKMLSSKKKDLNDDFLNILKTASDTLTHTTRRENLEKILRSGRLMPMRDIAMQDPEAVINIEHKRGLTARKDARASELKHKNHGKIFFAADRYDPRYGDYTIIKKLKNSEKNPIKLTMIPDERIVRNPVSVRSNATIYVPHEELAEWKNDYKGYRFQSKEDIPLEPHNLYSRLKGFVEKFASYSDKPHPDAKLIGSSRLGLETTNSDKDYMIPFDSMEEAKAEAQKFLAENSEYTLSKYNSDDKGRVTIKSEDIDITFAWYPKAQLILDNYQEMENTLTEPEISRIVEKRKSLKDSWLFPETRYRNYKHN